MRARARELARSHVADGDPLGWFEALYAEAGGDAGIIPWADLDPNPNLVAWLDSQAPPARGARALKVGCGLGDDAEELAARGYTTTAFDVSESAIHWCRRRFPDSSVRYHVADLLAPPSEWTRAFDLVVESYTLQVLPAPLRPAAIRCVSDFVAPGGRLLVIARVCEEDEPEGAMPWPLTVEEVELFDAHGLTRVSFEDFMDGEEPPVRRIRATYVRR